MDFTLDDEALAVVDLVAEVLDREGVAAAVRDRPETVAGEGTRIRTLTEIGLPALLVPEPDGLGFGLVETAAVMEQAGRALLPEDVASTIVLSQALAETAHGARLLAGEWTAAFDAPPFVRLDGGRLSGTARVVLAPAPDVLVVLVDGSLAALVDPASPGVTVRTDRTDPSQPYADVTLHQVLAEPVPLSGVVPADVRDRLRLLRTAAAVGGMAAAVDTTISYVRVREQFGKPIGSFQVVKHQIAELWTLVEQARAVVRMAAITLDGGSADTARDVAAAVGFVTEAYPRVAAGAVHLHGGMGYAWESGLHMHVRRALVLPRLVGGAREHRAAVLRNLLDAIRSPEPV